MSLKRSFAIIDHAVVHWMAANGFLCLRISLGLIFFWFGFLKFFPKQSPAEEIAVRTIMTLSMGVVPSFIILPTLAAWEVVIGLGLIFKVSMRITLLLLYVHMAGTLSPLVLFPHELFVIFPFVPTLTGQYIIKNLVLISAGIVLGATVRKNVLSNTLR